MNHQATIKSRCALAAAALLAAASAQAGGHFDVDDAGMLDPGQCQYEAWGSRVGRDPATYGLHLGPSCRVGPVELGLNLDRSATRGERGHVYIGPQAKWTFYGQAPDAPLAVALSVSAVYDTTAGGRPGGQLLWPVSWRVLEPLTLHVNLGADWLPGTGARTARGGLAGEWAIGPVVSLIAERNRAFDLWTTRFGLRFSFTPLISLDVSAARIGSGQRHVNGFVIGLNHEFSVR